MSVDHSLNSDFPTVTIHGQTYRYGKETEFGQYLVENAENAKDYWCFDTAEELRDFLTCLPESAVPLCYVFSDWHSLSEEQRTDRRRQRNADLHKLAESRKATGPWFTILQYDEQDLYSIPNLPTDGVECNSLDIAIDRSGAEPRVQIKSRIAGHDRQIILTISWRQAMRLAGVMINAVRDIEFK